MSVEPLAPTPLEENSYISMCSHGPLGTSKTWGIRSLIEGWGLNRVAIIEGEKGLQALHDLNPPHVFKLITKADIANMNPPQIAQKYMDNLARAYQYITGHLEDFDWIAFDGFTNITDQIQRWALHKKKIGLYNTSQGKEDTQSMYGDMGRTLGSVIHMFKALPVNFYINTLSEVEVERKTVIKEGKEKQIPTGRVWRQPALVGRMNDERFPAAWDAVIAMKATYERDPESRKIRKVFWADVHGDETVVARLRTPPTRPVPRMLRFGTQDHNGNAHFEEGTDWNLCRLWEAMTGLTRPEKGVS